MVVDDVNYKDELERFSSVVRQYVNSKGESRAAEGIMLSGLEYIESLLAMAEDKEELKNPCPCGTQQLCPEDGCSAYKEYKAKLLTLTEREKNILFSPFRDDWC